MTRSVLLLLAFLTVSTPPAQARDWRTASRESVGIAPLPDRHPEAVVQVYAARAIRWRGWFAVHTWIATKEKDAEAYTVYHVTRWRLKRSSSVIAADFDIPDRHWFGARPRLIDSLIGPAAQSAIPKIKGAVADYPYTGRYRVWPGPNSNTFTSFVLRRVPELTVELPPHAVGKDFLGGARFFGRTESGTGVQASLFGVLAIAVGLAEGVEVNVLGLNFGVDLLRPALKLPIIGRIGFLDAPPPFK